MSVNYSACEWYLLGDIHSTNLLSEQDELIAVTSDDALLCAVDRRRSRTVENNPFMKLVRSFKYSYAAVCNS
jgi:hypothetical protein